ncbi:MAG: hypothetical protein ACKPKO_29790, partial [Candidatus Fonsibacter sp.]
QQRHKASCGKPTHPSGGEPTTAQGQLRQAITPERRRANNGTRPTAASTPGRRRANNGTRPTVASLRTHYYNYHVLCYGKKPFVIMINSIVLYATMH